MPDDSSSTKTSSSNVTTPATARLEGLADQIRDDLGRREHGREEWIAATIDLCRHLAEARARLPSNEAFGQWCEAQRFGLGHQDRAAAIQMGQHMAEARPVLEQTERRSLQHIYAKEFRLTQMSNSPDDDGVQKPNPTKPPPRHEKRADERQHQASINLRPEVWAAFKAQAEAQGVSAAARLGELATEAASLPTDLDERPTPAKARFDKALREARIEIRAEEAEVARREIRRIFDEHVLPEVNKKHERAERIIAGYKGLISRADYRKLLACLHPDSAPDEARKARFAEAFQIVKDLEELLVKPEPKPANPAVRPLPKTAAELYALRRTRR